LVLAGLTGGSTAASAVERLVALWEWDERAGARARLGAAARGVLFQRLVPAEKGKRRTASAELLRGEALIGALGRTDAVEPRPAGD
jgi:Tfp pilus assembly pilus retraction ATPase PilT